MFTGNLDIVEQTAEIRGFQCHAVVVRNYANT